MRPVLRTGRTVVRQRGGLPKRFKGAHSKCVRPAVPVRGFESHVLR